MTEHQPFHYRSLAELEAQVQRLGLEELACDPDLSPLAQPVKLGPLQAPNALAIQPMEGCDGEADGSPGELTRRRYRRFAAGGAGLLWCEACAVAPEGRANPRQLWLHEGNLGAFASLLQEALAQARDRHGQAHRPVTVLQLTHSGRYSRPQGAPAPLIAQHNPFLDPPSGVPADLPPVSDDYLNRLPEAFVAGARLAQRAGFDAVDIKACHGYLVHELLAAFTRPGRYGGDFAGRTRFLVETIARVRAEVTGLVVTTRLNAYDAVAYPYGWGVDREDAGQPDLAEPVRLVRLLAGQGLPFLNLTIGNPYYNPHYGRPYDQPALGGYPGPEHPLEGMARIVRVTRDLAQAVPGLPVIGFGYSWLRQYLGHFAAANLRRGWMSMAGLGRMAFAYPDFPNHLLAGTLDPRRVCRTCSKCTQIMRDGGQTGCVLFDPAVYLPIYRAGRERAGQAPGFLADH